jgi:hypothetical protein
VQRCRFLQLLCENHNTRLQDYVRRQTGAKTTTAYNLVQETLLCLDRFAAAINTVWGGGVLMSADGWLGRFLLLALLGIFYDFAGECIQHGMVAIMVAHCWAVCDAIGA